MEFFDGGKKIEFEDVICENAIKEKVQEIGLDISRKYKNNKPVIICVLNGAFLFMSDLIRNLTIDYEVDFIKIGSYGNNFKSSGSIELIKDVSINLEGRDVIIVEDIIDSGLSINFLKNHIQTYKPNSLRFVTMLYRENLKKLDFIIDWIGFKIDNGFYVGYGLDYKQLLRGLPSIKKIKEKVA